MKLNFRDLYQILIILEDLEDKDVKDKLLLGKVQVIVKDMQAIHARKNKGQKK